MSYLTIHDATEYNYCKEVRQILRKNPDEIDERDEYGRTALHIALKHRHMKIFRMLLEWGANVFIRDFSGRTILQYA